MARVLAVVLLSAHLLHLRTLDNSSFVIGRLLKWGRRVSQFLGAKGRVACSELSARFRLRPLSALYLVLDDG